MTGLRGAEKRRAAKRGSRKSSTKKAVKRGRLSRPSAFSPPPGGGQRAEPVRHAKSSAPATEWERLWRRYTSANKSGSLKEQLAAGKALLRFDRTHGTPPLPSLAKKLRTAKQLLVRHEEAFREAKALKHEIGKAEKSMHRRKSIRKAATTPSRRKALLSRLLSG